MFNDKVQMVGAESLTPSRQIYKYNLQTQQGFMWNSVRDRIQHKLVLTWNGKWLCANKYLLFIDVSDVLIMLFYYESNTKNYKVTTTQIKLISQHIFYF